MARNRPPKPQGPRPAATTLVQARLQQAYALQQRGQLREAAFVYRELLAQAAANFDVLQNLGIIEAQLGNLPAAIELMGRAAQLNPGNAQAHFNLALALQQLQRMDDAVASYDRALKLNPRYADAWNNRGTALQVLGGPEDALASYEKALRYRPAYPDALVNRGNVLKTLGRPAEALVSYDRALALDPRLAEASNGRGNVLLSLRRYEEALSSFERALAAAPGHVEALNGRGFALAELQRLDEALASYERVLAVRPNHEKALMNRGMVLLSLKRHDEAAASFARLLGLVPGHGLAKGHLLLAKSAGCDWNGIDAVAESVAQDIRAGRTSADPFNYQAVSNSEEDLKRCAEIHASDLFPAQPALPGTGEHRDYARIRVGYLSGEFRSQATSILITGLFELHDRSCFELYAFDNGWDDGSELRARINRAFDEIVPVSRLDDRRAAELIRDRSIDILVNLNGYFGASRTGIFAHRPCPVQVNYLGFPGTLGASYMDYIIADAVVIPPGHDGWYSEQVVRLPETYQVNDSKRRIAERTPGRGELDLPGTAFVFCCFNNSYKITAAIFATWMRLLEKVPNSVLWLLEDNAPASRNLRREAAARGVAPERLVFAPRIGPAEHLARHNAANLFLDTLPYNAHTTASDALWAGLPVLTCSGTTFPGRVAASLLQAVGLPELVTGSLAEYEALALQLATDRERLARLTEKLAHNRLTHPLFDTDRFRRHIESAYVTMWERARRGEAPMSFTVPAEP